MQTTHLESESSIAYRVILILAKRCDMEISFPFSQRRVRMLTKKETDQRVHEWASTAVLGIVGVEFGWRHNTSQNSHVALAMRTCAHWARVCRSLGFSHSCLYALFGRFIGNQTSRSIFKLPTVFDCLFSRSLTLLHCIAPWFRCEMIHLNCLASYISIVIIQVSCRD